MEEQAVKKRGWVKNAAIIFLSIMLVLTFFSQTILNHSLPEVAVATVESGSINARIRGSGTVAAGESYDVILDQTRKVQTVLVKVGDQVEVGDTLFILADAESDELKQAQETLDDLQLSYQKALLNLTDTDYARENRDIQKAKEALNKAKAAMTENIVTSEEIAMASANVKDCERYQKELNKQYTDAEKALTDAQDSYDGMKSKVASLGDQIETLEKTIDEEDDTLASLRRGGSSNASAKLDEAKKTLAALKREYAALRVNYGDAFDSLQDKAQNLSTSSSEEDILYQMEALYNRRNDEIDEAKKASEAEARAYEAILPVLTKMKSAENDVEKWQELLSSQADVQAQISKLLDSLNEHEDELSSLKSQLKKAKKELSAMESNLTRYSSLRDELSLQLENQGNILEGLQEVYNTLLEKKERYDVAESQKDSCQTTLEDLIFALTEQKKNDNKQMAQESLDMKATLKEIEDQKELVAKLQADSVNAEIKANAAGMVSAINVSAGHENTPGTPMAVIEVVDRGYTLRFPVTNEQSQKVRLGDPAEVSNYYWGASINAILTQILPDPTNPGSGKVLVFTVSGDVSAGQNLTLSVGQKSANYDAIVPSSAVRNDSNGTFVLVVSAKNTPMGNRYTATRVDVTVQAQDDTKSAVTGLSWGDFVITTSSKPLDAGAQVKMVDNQ